MIYEFTQTFVLVSQSRVLVRIKLLFLLELLPFLFVVSMLLLNLFANWQMFYKFLIFILGNLN